MDSSPHPGFARRENKDGSFDCVCMKCYATVASSLQEAELEQGEQTHQCDPAAVERLSIERLNRAPFRGEPDNRSGGY